MCNGIHFNGFIVDVKHRHIILVDSFCWKEGKKTTALRLGEILFGGVNVSFSCFYKCQKEINGSNSCAAWLVAGMSAYVNGQTKIKDCDHAFSICYGLITKTVPNKQMRKIDPNSFPL